MSAPTMPFRRPPANPVPVVAGRVQPPRPTTQAPHRRPAPAYLPFEAYPPRNPQYLGRHRRGELLVRTRPNVPC